MLPAEAVHQDFHRGLKERHIQMIAIGGAIGVGLFLGSAKAIQQAGPSLLSAYVVAGFAIFLIMRALGELLLYRPVADSFATCADEFVGPWAGFVAALPYPALTDRRTPGAGTGAASPASAEVRLGAPSLEPSAELATHSPRNSVLERDRAPLKGVVR